MRLSYRLRMHSEIHAWLTDLRVREPELARHVGEAVVAMLEAGESLGPPLVVPLDSLFSPPDDPREALDRSYQRQIETLASVRRGVADMATSRKRLELQEADLQQTAVKLASQSRQALGTGREDLAREAQARASAVQEQLSGLREQLAVLRADEERLTAASQRLQAKIDGFRTRKETIKATYTAGEAARRIREALASIGEDARDLDSARTEAGTATAAGCAPTAADEDLAGSAAAVWAASSAPGSADQGGSMLPAGLKGLLPDATGPSRVGLLFAVQPPGTAVLLAQVADPGRSPGQYQDTIRLAAARLATADPAAPAAAPAPGGPAPAAPAPGTFIQYDAESFLDEFFPGEGTEVEVGAAALAARSRACTLAQARQRIGLTQAQVAHRMNVRQERVSAIERAEPGATEVRTLAAYVTALGGRLEIIADIAGEHVTLR